MAKQDPNKYILMSTLAERIRTACKKNLKEKTDNNLSIFFSPSMEQDEFCFRLDHSSSKIFVSINRPILKVKRVFDLKKTDILVGTNYIEFFESEWNFVHLDFDPQNIKHEKETTPKAKSEPKSKRINKKGALF